MATLRESANQNVLAYLDRFPKQVRPIRVGQLAFPNVSVHRGHTDVPKYGVWVNVERIEEDFVVVRIVAPRSSSQSIGYVGNLYRVSKSSLSRIDVHRYLNVDYPTDYEHLTNEEKIEWRKVSELVATLSRNQDIAARYHAVRRGSAQQRLSSRMAAHETRAGYRAWNYLNYSATSSRLFLQYGRQNLKDVGLRTGARLRKLREITTGEQAVALYNELRLQHENCANRFRHATAVEQREISKMLDTLRSSFNVRVASCGHATLETTNVHPLQGYCMSCLDNYVRDYGTTIVDAIDNMGDRIRALASHVYTWEDGSYRTYEEPPIIGGYHSNKNSFHKSLPHITGDEPRPSVLKLGYELEFVRNGRSNTSDNVLARRMKRNIETTLAELFGPNFEQKYCGFERDGTVDFEMVSGYGPIDLHRAVLLRLLADDELKRHLNSHNGGKCGLHVHLDKPKSLMHSVRLQAFYNNPFNENLIRAIARRYGRETGYSRVKGEKGDMIAAAKTYKRLRTDWGSSKERALLRAITSLTSERYEIVNFQPDRTVEIRAFRGSLVAGTVLACLEFAVMSYYFARDTTKNQLTEENFLKYISLPEWRHESRYLRKYLWGKGFKVWMPKKQARAHVVEQ